MEKTCTEYTLDDIHRILCSNKVGIPSAVPKFSKLEKHAKECAACAKIISVLKATEPFLAEREGKA